MNRVFDRRIQFDNRSRNFPIRMALPSVAPPRSYTWSCPIWLDQGSEGACVGFSVAQEAAARPVSVKNVTTDTAQWVYRRAQELDIWPGQDYDGTSVIAGIKAGKELGWYQEYRWAFGLNDLILALGYKGPAVLGINWYEGMFDTDARGLVHVTGSIVGGHAILATGVSVKKKLVRLHNSWGQDWGLGGDCYISFDDLNRLLHEEGEACIPVKRSLGT